MVKNTDDVQLLFVDIWYYKNNVVFHDDLSEPIGAKVFVLFKWKRQWKNTGSLNRLMNVIEECHSAFGRTQIVGDVIADLL